MGQPDISSHWVWDLYEKGLTLIPLGTAGEQAPPYLVQRHGSQQEANQQWPKTPRERWADWQKFTPGETQITEWLLKYPGCNFAIVTGKEVNVVDADDQAAIDFIQANLTRTPWMVRTGKGAHFYYQTSPTLIIKNSADKSKIDTRGVGGYVVAPGSTHATGRQYTLEIDPAFPVESVVDLPTLTGEDLQKIAAYRAQFEDARPVMTVTPDGKLHFDAARFAPGNEAGVQKGSRDDNMTRLVGKWVQEGLSINQLMARAKRTDEGNTPPLGEANLLKIIQSVVGTHLRNNDIEPEVPELNPEVIKESASLVGIDEMMALASQSLPWLIKPFFYLDSTVCIFGPPKQFKTFVALDMALSIATGLPFMGKWEVRRPGMVVYVAGEGVFGVSHRVRAWALSKGIPDEEFTTENVPFYRTKGSIPISDGGADEMARQCQELSEQAGLPINAIIIDTVARNFGSGNESDTKDMNQFISRCDTDIKERFGCCTVLVHHTGHNERDRPRGSMVLPGAMDGLIRVTAEEDSKLIEVAPLFYKDSETPDGFLAQPNKVDLGYVDEDGDPIESIALAWMGQGIIDAQERYSPDEKLLLSLVSDEPKPSMILRDDFIHEAMKMPVQKGKNKGEKRNNRACSVAYGRAFNKLLEKGLLQQCDSGIVAGNFDEKQ